jgi:integrase
LLLAQGVHPRFIMELFGHSSISLTMNTYVHVLEEMKDETARKMDDALNPVAVSLAVNSVAAKAN